jgi:tetratricopeptide (TPR) repeat protein
MLRHESAAALRTILAPALVWLLAPSSQSVHAQRITAAPADGEVIQEVDVVHRRTLADDCGDAERPPAQRVVSCTQAMAQMRPAELAKDLDEREDRLLGKTPMAGDPRGNALPEKTALGRLLDERGLALAALGKHPEAIADFTQALQLNNRDLAAFCARANLYLDVNPNREILINSNLQVEAFVDSSVAKTWMAGISFYNQGVKQESLRQPDQALDAYRNAVALLPAFARAHALFGRLLIPKDPNAALAELTYALQLDASSPALINRASLNLSLGRLEPALQDFTQIIARDAADHLAYLSRGLIKERLGNLPGALEDYSRSIALAPSAAAHFDRANAYVQMQEPQQALAEFNAALAIDPQNIQALIGRADLQYGQGDLAASLGDYTRLVAAQPRSADAHFKRGSVYFDLGNYPAAIRDFSASLTLDPQQPAALYNRALAAEHLGSKQDAEQDRRRARALEVGANGP